MIDFGLFVLYNTARMGCLQNKNTQIEQYVSIYLKISDMAVILGISATQLREDIADKSTEVSRRYHRGKAASRVELLHLEMQLAYVGSPLALENTRNNLLDMEDDE